MLVPHGTVRLRTTRMVRGASLSKTLAMRSCSTPVEAGYPQRLETLSPKLKASRPPVGTMSPQQQHDRQS
jgi:hypothetical protein